MQDGSYRGKGHAREKEFVFDLVNRLADAFGYSFGDEAGRLAEARALYRLAYKVPGFLPG